MSNFIIRLATKEDLSAVAEIHVRSWQYAYAGIIDAAYLSQLSIAQRTENWSRILSKQPENLLVEQDSTDIRGWVSFGENRDADRQADRLGEIFAIYVHPSHLRKGIGKRLLDEAEKVLIGRKFKIVTLWVLEKNHLARSFYETAGYVWDQTNKVIEIGGTPLTEIRYRKVLE